MYDWLAFELFLASTWGSKVLIYHLGYRFFFVRRFDSNMGRKLKKTTNNPILKEPSNTFVSPGWTKWNVSSTQRHRFLWLLSDFLDRFFCIETDVVIKYDVRNVVQKYGWFDFSMNMFKFTLVLSKMQPVLWFAFARCVGIGKCWKSLVRTPLVAGRTAAGSNVCNVDMVIATQPQTEIPWIVKTLQSSGPFFWNHVPFISFTLLCLSFFTLLQDWEETAARSWRTLFQGWYFCQKKHVLYFGGLFKPCSHHMLYIYCSCFLKR